MKKGITYGCLFFIFSSFIVLNDTDFTSLVQEKLQNYSQIEWPEKVYIQTDKTYYTINDTIWFTTYLVNGVTHLKSTKSTVIYVELINEQDSILQKRKLYVKDISTHGDFKIEEDWNEGEYAIRAYTNYMRNEDPDFFFQKKIAIWGQNKEDTQNTVDHLEASVSLEKPILNFYPEGGHLVENLRSKIAFKIQNDIYNKTPIIGYIKDNEDVIVTEFKTLDFGLGVFYLKPEPHKSYYAHIDINGAEYNYQLPEALPVGYNLTINNRNDNLLVEVNSNRSKGLSGSYLLLHQRGKILFNKLVTENKNNFSLNISTTDLKDGVAHLTLFNHEGHPVCERLVYIDNAKNKAHVKIKTNKVVLGTREKVSLKLNVDDSNGYGLPSYLSMSVRNLNTVPNNKYAQSIKTWLLLNSDLRGEVKNPGYFFSEDADYKSQYLLDVVMLTNGWRRFTWQNLLYDTDKVAQFAIEKDITISGTTKLLKSPDSVTPAFTSLTFLGEQINVLPDQKSNAMGKFSYGPFVLYDSIQTIIQARLTGFESEEKNYRDVLIMMDQDTTSPEVKTNTTIATKTNKAGQIAAFLKMAEYSRAMSSANSQNTQKLDEVLVSASKKEKREKEMSERSMFDSPSYRLDIASDNTLSNQTVISLIARFPGVSFTGKNFSIRGGGPPPRILLDDVDVDLAEIANLAANQISFIDYYRNANAAIYSNSMSGVITIYLKRGDDRSFTKRKRKPGIINFYVDGFYTAKEFYAPEYSIETHENTKFDIRSTLYWNPKIRIMEQSQTEEISFFTGDLKGDYIIEVEGISDSGIPLHQTRMFSVE